MNTSPCEACPVGDSRCRGLLHARDCHNVRSGVPGYAEMLRSLAGVGPPPAHGPIPPGQPVVIRSHLHPHGGYGQMVEHLGVELERLGVPVRYDPIAVDESFMPLPDWSRRRIAGTLPPHPWTLLATTPEGHPPSGRRLAWLSMWETDRLRPEHADGLNRAEVVIVPCRWNAEAFAASGVSVPIRVVPLGIDPAEYHADGPRPGRRRVFGVAGRMAHGGARKGIAEAVDAFLAAFPTERDVRLRVKVWDDCPIVPPDDPRVEVLRRPLTTAEMAAWYRSLDCFVSASRGEGFGLQPLQAMACGRPAICTDFGGHAEYATDESCYLAPYDLAPATGYYEGLGRWGVPTHEGLVGLMRRVYRDPDEAAAKGRAAALRAREFTWCASASLLRAALVECGMLPKPRVALGTPVRSG